MPLNTKQLEAMTALNKYQVNLQTVMKVTGAMAEDIADAIIDGQIAGEHVLELCGPGTTLGVLVPMRRSERTNVLLLEAVRELRDGLTSFNAGVHSLRDAIDSLRTAKAK